MFQNQTVPKVIVMGSSTASETTINTSTDSSNTIVTTMTATDGDVTEDSLDINDPIDYLNSENILDSDKLPKPVLQPIPVTPKTPSTAKQTPPTAKQETKFTFELDPQAVKDDSTPKAVRKDGHLFLFGEQTEQKEHEEKTVDKLMEEQIEALKLEAKRRNSYKAAQADFDKIEVVDTNKIAQNSPKEHRRSFRRKLDVDKEKHDSASPKRRAEHCLNSSPENETASPKPKHR